MIYKTLAGSQSSRILNRAWMAFPGSPAEIVRLEDLDNDGWVCHGRMTRNERSEVLLEVKLARPVSMEKFVNSNGVPEETCFVYEEWKLKVIKDY